MPHHPKPWRRFWTRTQFLRVPSGDWQSVKRGYKREFRVSGPRIVDGPLAVGYAFRKNLPHDSRLLVIENTWQEPIHAITPESLEREGFPDMATFRRYWMSMTKKPYRPLQPVTVFQVHPFEPEELNDVGLWMVRKLYQEHLPDDV